MRSAFLGGSALAAAMLSVSAQAEFQYTFTGIVSGFFSEGGDPDPDITNAFSFGDPVTLTFSIDPATPDSDPGSGAGVFNGVIDIAFSIGAGFSGSSDPTDGFATLEIGNNISLFGEPSADGFELDDGFASFLSDSIEGNVIEDISLQLVDEDGTAFDSARCPPRSR